MHRITPAGAGKTTRGAVVDVKFTDHPRRCGENNNNKKAKLIDCGSPPQVRGKQSECKSACAVPRITPAGAGKTADCAAYAKQLEDHPRRCGENHQNHTFYLPNLGSPPQVRGKLINFISLTYHFRITPAGAGKTTIPITKYISS